MRTRIAAVVAALAVLVAVVVAVVTLSVPRPEALSEEDSGWNCLTMGNHLCGDIYVPVSSALADTLTEGNQPDVDWNACLTDQTVVVCPDGTVVAL